MEERMCYAFAGTEQLTVIGRRLHPGGTAPDFRLNYLDLVDMAVHTVRLSDLAGMVLLLNVVNSLERPVCQVVTRRWEALCVVLPPDACIYTVSIDSPEMQIGGVQVANPTSLVPTTLLILVKSQTSTARKPKGCADATHSHLGG